MAEYTIHFGEALTTMEGLPDQAFDVAYLDLPFSTTALGWDRLIPVAPMWQQLRRLIKPRGAIICHAQDPFSSLLLASNVKGFRHKWIWHKRQSANFALTKVMPLTVTEDILIFTPKGNGVTYYPQKRKGKLRWIGSKNSSKHGRGFGSIKQVYYQSDERYPVNLIEFPAVARRHSLHPSQKPLTLATYLYKTYTKPGDRVLDISMGSATSVIAGLKNQRQVTGIENDPEIFDLANRRIEFYLQTGCDLLPKDLAAPFTGLPLLQQGV